MLLVLMGVWRGRTHAGANGHLPNGRRRVALKTTPGRRGPLLWGRLAGAEALLAAERKQVTSGKPWGG